MKKMTRLNYYAIFIALLIQAVATFQTNQHVVDPELLYIKEENNGSNIRELELFDSFLLNTQMKREHRDIDINNEQIMKSNTNSPTTI